MRARGNSQFTVGERRGVKYFLHGASIFEVLPASILEPGAWIIVRPAFDRSEEGRAVRMEEREGAVFFSGLERTVPSEVRDSDGMFGLLLPEWFESGDEVQLAIHSSTLRTLRAKFPGRFERPPAASPQSTNI